jgi:hypothetical protein
MPHGSRKGTRAANRAQSRPDLTCQRFRLFPVRRRPIARGHVTASGQSLLAWVPATALRGAANPVYPRRTRNAQGTLHTKENQMNWDGRSGTARSGLAARAAMALLFSAVTPVSSVAQSAAFRSIAIGGPGEGRYPSRKRRRYGFPPSRPGKRRVCHMRRLPPRIREFVEVRGFWLPGHVRSVASSLLLGPTELEILFSNYQLDPAPAAPRRSVRQPSPLARDAPGPWLVT